MLSVDVLVEVVERQDGPRGVLKYKKTTDLTKPKCYVEGFQYCFRTDYSDVQHTQLPRKGPYQ